MSGEAVVRAGATLLLVGIFYAFFYTRVVAHWGALVRPLVSLLRRDGSHPVRDIDALGKLAAAAVAQAAFAAALIAILGIDCRTIADVPGAGLIALGAALGIAELGFSAFICTLVVQAAIVVSGDPKDDWLDAGRGGWMGQFLASARVAPPWLFASCVVLYLAGEEIVFRALLIEALRSTGPVVAIGLSVACFVAVQALHMPSARSALFPMVGGLVVGSVHSTLYWQAPNVLPLIVAHATFFIGALGRPVAAVRSR